MTRIPRKHFQNGTGSDHQNDRQNSLAKNFGHMNKNFHGAHTREIQKYQKKFWCGKTLVT